MKERSYCTTLSLSKIMLFAFALLNFPPAYSQMLQKPLWSMRADYVKFSPLPGSPQSLINANYIDNTTQAQNAMCDGGGNLLFYVYAEDLGGSEITTNVYDKDGKFIGKIMDSNGDSPGGSSEIIIVPVPGECQEYYIITSTGDPTTGTTTGFTTFVNLYYTILDAGQTNPTTGAQGILKDINTGNAIADNATELQFISTGGSHKSVITYGVTDLRADATRILFANIESSIYTYSISQTGITVLNPSSPSVYSGLGITDDYSELEVIPSGINYRLAYAANNEVCVVEMDDAGNLISPSYKRHVYPTNDRVHGLEFSPDGNHLYVAHEQGPWLEYFTISPTSLSSPTDLGLSSAFLFGHSQIELAPYDPASPTRNLYFASLNSLEAISITSSGTPAAPGVWNSAASIACFLDYPFLNDQVDGENYAINPVFNSYTAQTSTAFPSQTQIWTVANNPLAADWEPLLTL